MVKAGPEGIQSFRLCGEPRLLSTADHQPWIRDVDPVHGSTHGGARCATKLRVKIHSLRVAEQESTHLIEYLSVLWRRGQLRVSEALGGAFKSLRPTGKILDCSRVKLGDSGWHVRWFPFVSARNSKVGLCKQNGA